MQIQALGYVGIGAPDPRPWLALGREMLGAMPARAVPGESWGTPASEGEPGPASRGSGLGEDGSVYLKLDERQWRIAVHPAPEGRPLLYLGLELAGSRELEQAVDELVDRGIDVARCSDEEASRRAVTALASLRDPAGNPIELFYGPTVDHAFRSPLGARFRAGRLGVGHVNLFVPDMAAALDFYVGNLGFRLSDYIVFGPGLSAQFLRCNERHHSIALTHVGPSSGLHHLMLELEDVDGVGQALDRAHRLGLTITSTLGRHRNDRMLSFYFAGPSGFDVEIGCEGLLVDESWPTTQFVEGDVWGHRGLTVEAIQEASRKL